MPPMYKNRRLQKSPIPYYSYENAQTSLNWSMEGLHSTLSQLYKLLVKKLFILNKGCSTPSKHLMFLSRPIVNIKQRES